MRHKTVNTCDTQDRFFLTTEIQQYVAGNTQRVAKLIAQQADFEVCIYIYISHRINVRQLGKGDQGGRVEGGGGGCTNVLLAL